MAVDKVVTEQDVNNLINETTARKLARETKESKRIYRQAISNVIIILTFGLGAISWPWLSPALPQGWADSVAQAAFLVGILAVLSLLEMNIRRIWQYRHGEKPQPFGNFFRL